MQISKIYTNLDGLFTPIDFNVSALSSRLNVVFAEVKRKKARTGDSHNLGKTTLIGVLDFLLLKDITSSEHFLHKHADRFDKFVFYLELAIHGGGFVTVRRSVSNPTSIALSKTDVSGRLDGLPENEWDHWDLGLQPACKALDAHLNLSSIAPWDYRVGVSYFLRTQADYTDYFQIQKFMQGKDRAWKPYLAAVLGLNHEAITLKYEIEDEISDKTKEREARIGEIDLGNRDRGELATRIEILKDEVSEIDTKLDGFDFHEAEIQINRELVEATEVRLENLSSDLYDINVDISQLSQSIKRGIKFDLKRIQEIFNESSVNFPDAIQKSYSDLVQFNRKLTTERNRSLKKKIQELETIRDNLTEEHKKYSDERQSQLAVVQEANTFQKFKLLQSEQSKKRAVLAFLENEMERVSYISELDRVLRDLKGKRDQATSEIDESLEGGSIIKTAVTQYFNRFVKQVLGINGEFFINVNSNGNIDFNIRTKDKLGVDTSQDKGNSYHRLLCALFDVSVLKALEEKSFYHFVYHDGILEGLDDRVKIRFLKLISEVISSGKVQYILSVIDSDLPRDIETEKKIEFKTEEIILNLHDRGDSGRLFKMAPF